MPRRRGPSREIERASTIDSGPPHRDTIPLTPQLGEVLGGRYVLQQQLGRGAFGVVYRARDQVAADVVALKLLAIDRKSPEQLERLRRELRSARRIHHPGIVRIHDLVEIGDHLALSMELIDGETLQARLDRDGPLKPAQLDALAHQLGDALAAAHDVGVAHRDLKPDNILIRDTTGRAVIADFGVARMLEVADEPVTGSATTKVGSGLGLTAEGAIVGTPLYMAPEQLAGREVGFPADLYALGVILYQAATGRPPHKADTFGALIEARLMPPPRIEADRQDLPSTFVDLVGRLLQRDPAARPTAAEIAKVLDDVPKASPTVETTVQTRPVPPRRRRAPGLALGALALIAAGLAIALLVTRRGHGAVVKRPLAVKLEVHADDPADARLEPAVLRMLGERLDDELRVVVARDGVPLSLSFHRDGAAVVIAARLEDAPLLEVDVPSVADGIDQVAAALSARAADRPERAPTAREAATMALIGAPSFAQYRRYHAGDLEGFLTENTDAERQAAVFEELIAADPGWLHPYFGLAVARGMTGPDTEQVLADARRAGDKDRDPRGWVILDAWDHFVKGEFTEAVEIASRVLDPDDLFGTWIVVTGLYFNDNTDGAIALYRRLYERSPGLQFGHDLIVSLSQSGRDDEVAATMKDWLVAAPGAEQALATQAKLAAGARDWAAARQAADDLLLLHGRDERRMVIYTDVLIAAGALAEAHAEVDRLFSGDETERARGLYRLGVLGTLEGRFTSAYAPLVNAVEPNRALNWNGETYQVLQALQSIAWAGEPGALAHWSDELADTYDHHGAHGLAAAARYEAAVARGPAGTCPDLETAANAIPDANQRGVARTQMLRVAAIAGCVPCSEVITGGMATRETSVRHLLMYATCAEREGAVDLARRAYEHILDRSTAQGLGVGIEGPFEWVVAAGRMGHLAEDAGDRDAARQWYQEVITRWGTADRPRPEVVDARAGLSRLAR